MPGKPGQPLPGSMGSRCQRRTQSPVIRAIGGGDAGDSSAQQQPKAWNIVSAGARDRTGCARRPFRCRGTGNAGSREAKRNPGAADPTSSRGRKIRNTIASSGDKSLNTLGGNHAGGGSSSPTSTPLIAQPVNAGKPPSAGQLNQTAQAIRTAQRSSQIPTAKLPPPSVPKPVPLRPRRLPRYGQATRRSRKCRPARLAPSQVPPPLQNRRPPSHPCRPQQWSSPHAAAITAGCQQGSRTSPSAAVGTSAEAGRTCASDRCFKAGGCKSPTEGMPARKKCGGDKWSARLQIGHQNRGGHSSWQRNTG